MKVKVQINDKKSLEELLALDAEFETQIKDKIIKEISDFAIKSAEKTIKSTIDEYVKNCIAKFVGENGEKIFEKDRWGNVSLSDRQASLIRDFIDRELSCRVMDEIKKAPEYKEFVEVVRKKRKSVWECDVKEVLREEAQRALRISLRDFENIAAAKKD